MSTIDKIRTALGLCARQIGDDALQVDDIAVRVLALVAERDELRHAYHEQREDAQGRVLRTVLRALAAEKERDELRARLAGIDAQKPVARQCTGCGSSEPLADLQHRGYISCCPDRDMQPLFARPVPAIPAGWEPVPVEATAAMLDAGQVAAKLALGHGAGDALPAIYRAMIAATPGRKP